jgi:competence protein ComEC
MVDAVAWVVGDGKKGCKGMNKIFWWGMGILVLMIGLVWWQWPEPGVQMVMCDVGQGDAILITEGFSQLLVDTGPEQGDVSACLGSNMPFWDMFVETVVITHADSDHVGGLDSVLRRYRVGKVITSQSAVSRVQEIAHNRTNVTTSWQGQQWMFGSISGVVKYPPYSQEVSKAEDANAQSLVVRLQWGTQSVWMAGDSDERVEERLLRLGLVEPTTILKVAHHGSASASTAPFLAILRPSQAWISVGKDNRYGHPTSEVLKRLSQAGIQIRRSDSEGTISVK